MSTTVTFMKCRSCEISNATCDKYQKEKANNKDPSTPCSQCVDGHHDCVRGNWWTYVKRFNNTVLRTVVPVDLFPFVKTAFDNETTKRAPLYLYHMMVGVVALTNDRRRGGADYQYALECRQKSFNLGRPITEVLSDDNSGGVYLWCWLLSIFNLEAIHAATAITNNPSSIISLTTTALFIIDNVWRLLPPFLAKLYQRDEFGRFLRISAGTGAKRTTEQIQDAAPVKTLNAWVDVADMPTDRDDHALLFRSDCKNVIEECYGIIMMLQRLNNTPEKLDVRGLHFWMTGLSPSTMAKFGISPHGTQNDIWLVLLANWGYACVVGERVWYLEGLGRKLCVEIVKHFKDDVFIMADFLHKDSWKAALEQPRKIAGMTW